MVHALRVDRLGLDVHLDTPESSLHDALGTVSFFGWAIPDVVEIQVTFESYVITVKKTVNRPDVTEHLTRTSSAPGHDVHGFSFSAMMGSFEVFAIYADGRRIKQYNGEVRSPSNVSRGRSNWLFLNSSNGILEQADGTLDPAPAVDVWDRYLQRFDALAADLGVDWCFSIAPSKELIVPELSPFIVSRANFLAKFLERSRFKHFFSCPVDELVRLRAVSYWPGDTHWSDVGAAIAVKDVLGKLGIDNDLDPASGIKFVKQPGDLQADLLGLHDVVFPMLDYRRTARLVFDNYRAAGGNTGRLMIWESDETVAERTLFVSGGSSFLRMWKFITPWFKRTVFLHGTGRIDPEFLRQVAPTHVLLQSNSRFMSFHPDDGGFAKLGQLLNPDHMSPPYACGYPYYDRIAAKLIG